MFYCNKKAVQAYIDLLDNEQDPPVNLFDQTAIMGLFECSLRHASQISDVVHHDMEECLHASHFKRAWMLKKYLETGVVDWTGAMEQTQ